MEVQLRKILLLQMSRVVGTPNPAITPLLTFFDLYAAVDVSDGDNALILLSSNVYHAVILVDINIVDIIFLPLWAAVRSYVDNGGRAIVSGYLAFGMPLEEASQVFSRIFFLPWVFAEPLHPAHTIKLTPRFERKRTSAALRYGNMESLPFMEYEARGMLLADVEEGLGVYVPKEGEFEEECITCTVDYRYGGSVSYIGDLGASEGEMTDRTRRVWAWILGMI